MEEDYKDMNWGYAELFLYPSVRNYSLEVR